MRGARYAARLHCALTSTARDQARQTLERWPWSWHPGDAPGLAPSALGTRLRMELELLLEREPWRQALSVLQDWGGLMLLDPALQADRTWPRRLRWAKRFGLPLLPALLASASDPLVLAERLQVPHRQHKLLVEWCGLRQRWEHLQLSSLRRHGRVSSAWGAEVWSQWLEVSGLSSDAVALELACGGGSFVQQAGGIPGSLPRRPLLRWWLHWRHLKAPFSAVELMATEGLLPGPALGERLRRLRAERLAAERC